MFSIGGLAIGIGALMLYKYYSNDAVVVPVGVKTGRSVPNNIEKPNYAIELHNPMGTNIGISDFGPIFDVVSKREGIPRRILLTIVRTEQNRLTGFDRFAFNPENAADINKGRNVDSIGLAQLLYPDTAKSLDPLATIEKLYDPEYNLTLSGKLISDLFRQGFGGADRDGFPVELFASYNAGRPRYIQSGPSMGKFTNQAYVNRAFKYWQQTP